MLLIYDSREDDMTYEFAQPQSMGGILGQLSGKSFIICPDTCVLLHMVREKQDFAPLDQIYDWASELSHIEKLLKSDYVGWVLPEQIKREFDANQEDVDKRLPILKSKIVKSQQIPDQELDQINQQINQKISQLEMLVKNNRQGIMQKSLVIEESGGSSVHDAWQFIYENQFPNGNDNQQMKDSVILCHLWKLAGQFNGTVYFWTFDNFGMNSSNKRFPQKPSDAYVEIIHDIKHIS